MAEIRFFSSNRLEILFQYLCEVLSIPLSSPFLQETIIVQSKVMERWLAMRLAEHFGVWANAVYPFPNAFINSLFSGLLPSANNENKFEKSTLTWLIFKLLPQCIDVPEFRPLKNYLMHFSSQLKEFQLASRIADVFDQYLFFRPDMIFEWEKNPFSKILLTQQPLPVNTQPPISGKVPQEPDQLASEHLETNLWQKFLWTKIIQEIGPDHRAKMRQDVIELLHSLNFDKKLLPERITIFSVTSLPPFHLDILQALSNAIDINFFLMNPCKEYWYDIAADREIAKKTTIYKGAFSAEELHLEKGNDLLASYGKLGQHFFSLLMEMDNGDLFPAVVKHESYTDPVADASTTKTGSPLLLEYIQSDILNLKERKPDQAICISQEDNSLVIHSCHSPMREIEILHDQLLNMLNDEPNLLPEDILVMAPDIENYAPFIHAVFDHREETYPGNCSEQINAVLPVPAPYLPYNLSDRSVLSGSILIEPFLYFLDLPESRFGVLQIIRLLETEVIRKKLQLAEEDVLHIKKWIKDTQIKWGIDEQDKKKQNLPPFNQNTWRSGLEQLLLGYAMSGEELLQGILPYEHIELSQVPTLGNFVAFIEELFAFVELLRDSCSLGEWADILSTGLERFFYSAEIPAQEFQIVQETLKHLKEKEEFAAYHEKLELAVIRSILKDDLTRERMGYNFLSGGVTFCNLLPMRSIPYKIICLLGMNDKAFPRITQNLGFDLMAKNFRRGDRSTALSDRYLFLETLLSARQKFYISYIGQNIQDNTEYPPSVVVCELIDTIRDGYKLLYQETGEEGRNGSLLDKILIKHRLQAFNPAYFFTDQDSTTRCISSPVLFSYSEENYQAALALLADKKNKKKFLTVQLPLPEDDFKIVSLEELYRFFSQPVKYFLNKRLGLYLEEAEPEYDDREPFSLSPLERYQLKQNLVNRFVSGKETETYFNMINAIGLLPHGNLGVTFFQSGLQESQIFLDKLNSFIEGKELKSYKLDGTLYDYRITGEISLWENNYFHYRCAPVKNKDRLRLWLTHLCLNYFAEAQGLFSGSITSTYLGEDESFVFYPLIDCKKHLHRLLDVYWRGLSELLPFFPDTSFEFSRYIFKKLTLKTNALKNCPPDLYRETELQAITLAQKKWLGSDYHPGEGSEDPYYQLCFKNIDPLTDEFKSLALDIYLPLLQQLIL